MQTIKKDQKRNENNNNIACIEAFVYNEILNNVINHINIL